jgi:hypothetical protein
MSIPNLGIGSNTPKSDDDNVPNEPPIIELSSEDVGDPEKEKGVLKKRIKGKIEKLKTFLQSITITKKMFFWIAGVAIALIWVICMYLFWEQIIQFLTSVKAFVTNPTLWYKPFFGFLFLLCALYLFIRRKSYFWKWFFLVISLGLLIDFFSHGWISQRSKDVYASFKKKKFVPVDSKEESESNETKDGTKGTTPETISVDTTRFNALIALLRTQVQEGKEREEILKKENAVLLDKQKKAKNDIALLQEKLKKVQALEKKLNLAKKAPAIIVGDPKDKARIIELEKTIRQLLAVRREKREEKTSSLPYYRGRGVRYYPPEN